MDLGTVTNAPMGAVLLAFDQQSQSEGEPFLRNTKPLQTSQTRHAFGVNLIQQRAFPGVDLHRPSVDLPSQISLALQT
jgi:hypothetical protein